MSTGNFTLDTDALAAIRAHVLHTVRVQVAEPVLSDMRHTVPIKTGRLEQSLGIEDDEANKVFKVGSRDVDYSVDVELGTSHADAQPYMRPAVYRHRRLG